MAGRSLVQERVVGGKDGGEVPLDRRNSKGGLQGAGTKLGGVAGEEALDGRRAGRGIEARVRLGGRRIGALGLAAGVRNYHRQPARDRLGDAEAVRLVRAAMDENVRRGEELPQPRAILLEAEKAHPRRSASFEPGSIGPVSEEHEDGL